MRQWWLMAVAGGVVVGTAIVSFLSWSGLSWLFLAAAAACLPFFRAAPLSRFFLLACLAAALAGFRAEPVFDWWRAAPTLPERLSGEALVAGAGERHERSVTAPLRFERCDDTVCPEALLLGQFPQYAELSRGERIRVVCRVALPDNEALGFDYRMYLAKEGIGAVCRPTEWERLPERQWYAPLFALRGDIQTLLVHHIPRPESGLVSGLLLGGDEGLSRAAQEDFKAAGLSHIVAVSGYNVTIVAETLLFILVFAGLRRRQAFLLILAGVWGFVLLSGASASAIRAGVMGSLVFVAFQFGRPQLGMRALCLAAAGMLFWNPLLLRYDVGFQLSFAATLGIMLSAGGDVGRVLGARGFLVRLGLATLAAQAFVAPLLLHHFHMLSLVGLLANLVVLPLLPATMLLGAFTAGAGAMSAFAGTVFGWTAYIMARTVFAVTETAAQAPFAEASVAAFPWWAVVLWYAALGGAWLLFRKRFAYAA